MGEKRTEFIAIRAPKVRDPEIQRALDDFAVVINRELNRLSVDRATGSDQAGAIVGASEDIDISSETRTLIASVSNFGSAPTLVLAKGVFRDTTNLATCLVELRESNEGGVVRDRETVVITRSAGTPRFAFSLMWFARVPVAKYVVTATASAGSGSAERIADVKLVAVSLF